ncbi:unnamed protein product [Prunus brigantina]
MLSFMHELSDVGSCIVVILSSLPWIQPSSLPWFQPSSLPWMLQLLLPSPLPCLSWAS